MKEIPEIENTFMRECLQIVFFSLVGVGIFILAMETIPYMLARALGILFGSGWTL